MLSLKRGFQKVYDIWGCNRKGRPQMPNLLRFVAIFSCIPHFPAFLLPSPLSSNTSPFSHFSLSLPFPKEVNEKLNYM